MDGIEYEIKPANRISLNFKELWQQRELFFFFAWRDIKVKYKQTALGFVWAILQPLLMMLIFTFFFGGFKELTETEIPYPVFVYSGIMLWNIFSSGITNSGNSMINNSNIIKKVYFPRLIIPFSSIIVSLFDFLMTLVVYAGLLIYYKIHLDPLVFVTYLCLAILITLLFTSGLGILLAALNIKFRDFRYVIPFMLQALMFLTPVIYPVTIIKNEVALFLLNLNPMTAVVMLARSAISGMPVDWSVVMYGSIVAVLIAIVGLIYFRKTEHYFADLA